ncbi:MAG TPA: UvrD-helicase domain-containing protein [Kiritimatiellia bacterium]|nr:UvrD-helicase domain-containing protein [Kiritimatiellia bacterium]
MTDYSKLLNPEQCEAATAGDGPLLVLAAAGTGKTRTLVYRVAYLVERGERPDGLLLLTFTNRAAREMLERAKEVAGNTVGNLLSGTYHPSRLQPFPAALW